MQLTDFQIEALAKQGMIKPFNYQCLNSFGYDMTLGRTFKRFVGKVDVIDVNNIKENDFEKIKREFKSKYESVHLGFKLEIKNLLKEE